MNYPGHVPHVALIGKAGAGKSTVAQLLCDRFELGYKRLSFAAPLKVMCGTQTDRDLLQRVGVGVRELVEDAWVNLFLDELRRRNYPDTLKRPGEDGPLLRSPRFVVDDCRFPNELDALQAEGFIVVRVQANYATRVARLQTNGKLTDPEQLNHLSEIALDDAKAAHVIWNDNVTEDDLVVQLEHVLNRARR